MPLHSLYSRLSLQHPLCFFSSSQSGAKSELYTQVPGNVAGVSASGLLLSCSGLLMSSLLGNSHFLFSHLVKPVAFLGPLIISEASDLESGRHGIGIEESEALPVDKFLIYGDQGICTLTDGNCPDEEICCPEIELGKKLGALFQEKPCCETDDLEGMEVGESRSRGCTYFNKVVDEEGQNFHNGKSDPPWMKGSEAKTNDGEDDPIDSNNNDNDGNLRGFGCTRRGKQWNRTLACKLMEERRHNTWR